MNILETIGNTPLVDLSPLSRNPGVSIFGKMEGNNPGGSVKDRPAFSMIAEAEKRGDLKPGMTIIEATSGNTGIALALIAGVKGYDIELVMPENATRERVLAMEAYGARVILTPETEGMEGSIDFTRNKVEKGGAIMLDQFSNPDNPLAHYRTTGPEIWRQTEGKITHFVSAMGTTGTIMGVSRYLKEVNPSITVVGAQPTEGSSIPGIRKWPEAYLPKIFDPSRIDDIIEVSQANAVATTRSLAADHGISCGMSAGGAVWSAVELSKKMESAVIVTIICDRGDRYLSSGLFQKKAETDSQ